MSAAFPACCFPFGVSASSGLDDPRMSSEFYPVEREMSYRVIRRKQGRQVAANAAEGDRAFGTAESTGDFLLDFEHANILLSQVIVKRHMQVMEEAQNGVLM